MPHNTDESSGGASPAPGERVPGVVRKTVGGVYEVEVEGGEVVEAALRGRLKLEQRTGERVVAGDRVEVERHAGGATTIESVAERRSQLVRRAPGRRKRRPKVIVANVDQVVAVFATAHPEPSLRMLDRFLVLAEANELAPVVVINKVDLVGEEEARERFAVYESIGYSVLYASATTGRGVEAVEAAMCGRTSVLTGPSGAGKSSLLNVIEPAYDLRVGEVRERGGKGRHTTVAAELLPLTCGGYVADTPGLRDLGLWGVPVEELDLHFPEFRPWLGECRFGTSCTHTHEPDCGVQSAVESGEISSERYESYRAIREAEETAPA